MPIEDYQNLTEADFEGLDPLVKEGEDRATRLKEVIDGWINASLELVGKNIYREDDLKTIEANHSVLKRIDLRDDSHPDADPIDLGRDLLRPLAERLNQSSEIEQPTEEKTEEKAQILCAVFLLGCKVHSIHASEFSLPGSLSLYGCQVEKESDFREATFGGSANFGGATYGGSADFGGAKFGGWADFGEAKFGGSANFGGATYGGSAEFRGAKFGGSAEFRGATFGGSADFGEAKFGGSANFGGAKFEGWADFGEAKFGGSANFGGATFEGWADFGEAKFGGSANFGGATYGGSAEFGGAKFGGSAEFRGAKFGGSADFSKAKFGGSAYFGGATFGGSAYFGGATFGGWAYFGGAKFLSKCEFYGADLRKATLSHGYLPLEQSKDWKYRTSLFNWEVIRKRTQKVWQDSLWPFLSKQRDRTTIINSPRWVKEKLLSIKEHLRRHVDWQRIGDLIEWRWVRSLGELTLMTRASYYSLAVVPLLAGLWGPLRTWILQMNGGLDETILNFKADVEAMGWGELLNVAAVERFLELLNSSTLDATMPTGWLLAFAAALSVVIAHFIYQTRAPELVKEHKEKDLVEEANELIRRGEEITDNWLRESVGYLEDAWQRMPHRHNAWFVIRGLRTVWIPDNIEDHFEDAREEEKSKKDERTEEAESESKSSSEQQQEESVESPSEETDEGMNPDSKEAKEKEEAPLAQQEVRAADRKRIAIEEGQKARYAVDCFTNRTSAWFSGGFYILGMALTLFILMRQFSYVLVASPAYDWTWQFLQAISKGWVVSAVAALLLVLIFTGAYYVEEPTKRKEM